MKGGGMIGSALAEQGNMARSIQLTKTQEKLAELERGRQLQDLDILERDTRRKGDRFLSKMRNFIGTSGAAGTASETALLDASAGEVGRQIGRIDISRDRIDQDTEMRLDNLRNVRKSLKRRKAFHLFNSVTGLAGGLMTNVAGGIEKSPLDTPVKSSTQTPSSLPQLSDTDRSFKEPGISTRSNIGSSKRGGIGGF